MRPPPEMPSFRQRTDAPQDQRRGGARGGRGGGKGGRGGRVQGGENSLIHTENGVQCI